MSFGCNNSIVLVVYKAILQISAAKLSFFFHTHKYPKLAFLHKKGPKQQKILSKTPQIHSQTDEIPASDAIFVSNL